jgi:hypothetical protein
MQGAQSSEERERERESERVSERDCVCLCVVISDRSNGIFLFGTETLHSILQGTEASVKKNLLEAVLLRYENATAIIKFLEFYYRGTIFKK